MVRSHSRLPISRPAAQVLPYAPILLFVAFLPEIIPEKRMLKFLGSTVGIIFLIGLVVVIVLLNLIF